MQAVEHARQPCPRLAWRVAAAVRLRDHGDEQVRLAMRRLGRQVRDQLLAAGGLVGDDQRHLERQTLLVEVDDDVLHGQRGRVLQTLDQIPPQPSRVGGGVGGEDDLVGPVQSDGVHARHERVGVTDLAARLDAFGRDRGERQVDAHLRRFTHRLVIDHQARRGLGLRHDQAEAHVAGGRALAYGGQQLHAAERPVGDHKDFLHWICLLFVIMWVLAPSSSPPRRSRAPAAR